MTLTRLGLWGAWMLLVWSVQATLLSLFGQTLGKMALGLRIVDNEDQSNPGFVRAVLVRNLVPFVALAFMGGLLGCFPLLAPSTY